MDTWSLFWNVLGKADNIFGIATVLFSGYAAYRLRKQSKQIKELVERSPRIEGYESLRSAHEGVKSIAPVAFAISLLKDNEAIRNEVQTFLDAQGWKMPIEELNMDGINSPQDMEEFLNKLAQKRRIFEEKKYTEIHLFIAGPVMAGVLVGAKFDNWIPVKLYHKPRPAPPQIYEYWTPLL